MFIFRHGSRRAVVQYISNSAIRPVRSYASRIDIPYPRGAGQIPTIDACPSPTCQCQEMPPGLDIELEQNINGTMAAYAEQVLISTGRDDWASKIETEDEGVLIRRMKELLGPKGKYSDVSYGIGGRYEAKLTALAIPQRHDHELVLPTDKILINTTPAFLTRSRPLRQPVWWQRGHTVATRAGFCLSPPVFPIHPDDTNGPRLRGRSNQGLRPPITTPPVT